MRNRTTSFDPSAVRAADQRQLMMWFGGAISVCILVIGLLAGNLYLGNQPNMPIISFKQEPVVVGCTGSKTVKIYRTADLVDLYAEEGELCAWKDARGGLRFIADKKIMDEWERYLRQKYAGGILCSQQPEKGFLGSLGGKPLPRPGNARILKTATIVCVIACEELYDCGEGKFVAPGAGDAARYEEQLRWLISRGAKPLPRLP